MCRLATFFLGCLNPQPMSTLDDFSPLESRFPKSAPTGAGHEQEMAQLAVNTAQMHVTKRWRFTHFSKLPTTPRVRAPSSPTFAAFGRAWALHLYAGAWSGSVSVYLNLTDVAKEASCTLDSLHCSIITPAGVPARAVDLPGPWVIAGELGLIHSGALLRTDLLEEKKQLMADDTLVIELKMTASWTPSDATPATRTSKDGGLAEDMGRLLDSGCHSDVTLLAEGEQLAAHKAQLAARSPVLKAMFEHPMSEALQGRVLLDDLSAQTLRQLLRCVVSLLFLCGLTRGRFFLLTASYIRAAFSLHPPRMPSSKRRRQRQRQTTRSPCWLPPTASRSPSWSSSAARRWGRRSTRSISASA